MFLSLLNEETPYEEGSLSMVHGNVRATVQLYLNNRDLLWQFISSKFLHRCLFANTTWVAVSVEDWFSHIVNSNEGFLVLINLWEWLSLMRLNSNFLLSLL